MTLYNLYSNDNSFTQQNYEFVHSVIDEAHTTTAWYETDAMSLASIVKRLESAGKGNTAACRRIKAAL